MLFLALVMLSDPGGNNTHIWEMSYGNKIAAIDDPSCLTDGGRAKTWPKLVTGEDNTDAHCLA